ncbi:MAG: hypothetical protein VX553_00120 [Pseudomonadota bacterium]|nr:hypothetical protein [Pseudomonadota bacterium]
MNEIPRFLSMKMKNVGYVHLHGHLALGVLPPERAPADDDLLSHLLFALKHEGVGLAILSETLPYLSVESLVAALEALTGLVAVLVWGRGIRRGIRSTAPL